MTDAEPYLGITYTDSQGGRKELRMYSDGSAWWMKADGTRDREPTTEELEGAKRAFWNLL